MENFVSTTFIKSLMSALFIGALSHGVAFAKSSRSRTTADVSYHHFPKSGIVAKQTWFWEKVFNEYPSSQVVIHDADTPDVMIDVLDFVAFSKQYKRGRAYTRKEKEALTEKYLKRYELACQRIARERQRAKRHGAMEARVLNVYSRNRSALGRLYRGQVSLRSQTGLADEFQRAASRSAKYLPKMEKIFARQHLPVDLTRIAFVESMFNTKAISKVGASGIWQFMRSTAKLYLNVNHYIDERNDPLTATHGAAKLLKSNYRHLKSWPLAITAYNHGAGGMSKAARTIGTKDINQIITLYNSNTFGFASKNFYAEFLAARNTYNSTYRHKRNRAPATTVARIKIPKPVSVHQLLRYTNLDRPTLSQHNPHILPRAYGSYRYKRLPKGLEINVPKRSARKIEKQITRIKG